MADESIRFVQIIAAAPGTSAWIGPPGSPPPSPMPTVMLYALDSMGVVWVYLGNKWVSVGGRPDGS